MTLFFKRLPGLLKLLSLLVLLAVVVAVFLFVRARAASGPQSATPAAIPSALTVSATSPQWQHWPQQLHASGGIFAWHEAVVAAELGGLAITTLAVDVGSRVNKGDVLARLSDAAIQANLAQQRANVRVAEVALSEARANAVRARAVAGSGALSEQQQAQYLLAEERAEAQLAGASAQLAAEEVRLGLTRIVAVDDGVITARTASLGAVPALGAELFRLLRQHRLEWRAELTAAQASQLAALPPGQRARLRLANGQQAVARLRQVAPTLDGNTRKALAYFDLPASTRAAAGMFAEGTIEIAEDRALTLPESALVLRDGHSYVFEVVDGVRVTRRKVLTGRRFAQRVEIVDGLAADAQVVSSGGAFLGEGDRISLAPATSATPATPVAASARSTAP